MSSMNPKKRNFDKVDDNTTTNSFKKRKLDSEQMEENEMELINYFLGIQELLESSNENQDVLIANIFKEIEKLENPLFVLEHPQTSRSMEQVIMHLSLDTFKQFIYLLILPNFLFLIRQKCSSFLVQKIIELIPEMLIREKQLEQSESKNSVYFCIEQMTSEILKECIENGFLIDIFKSNQTSFVIRYFLWICSGIVDLRWIGNKDRIRLHQIRKIKKKRTFDHLPLQCTKFVTVLTQNILENDSVRLQFKLNSENDGSKVFCGTVQVLLLCLFCIGKQDSLNSMTSLILEMNKQEIACLALKPSFSQIFQTIFEFGTNEMALNAMKNCFDCKQIRRMALDMNGNHVLQAMLRKLDNPKSVEYCATSIQHNITELMNGKKYALLSALIDAFERNNLKPHFIVKTITSEMKAFEFLKIGYVGSLLLKSIVKCNANCSVVIRREIMSFDKITLISMMKDPNHSHVIQALMECKQMNETRKWDLIMKMDKEIHLLCLNKFATFVIESVWNNVSFEYKKKLALRLIQNASVLQGSKLGMVLFSKFQLRLLLKNDGLQWENSVHFVKKKKKNVFVKKVSNGKKKMKKRNRAF